MASPAKGFKFWTEERLDEIIEVKQKRPDFYVKTPFGDILAEVKSIQEPGPLERRRNMIGSIEPEEFAVRIGDMVKKAAGQLKAYNHLCMPHLVALDNCEQLLIPLGPIELTQLFGVFEFRANLDPRTGKPLSPLELCHGKNRRLRSDQHTHVSAVAVNIPKIRFPDDDMSSERPMRLRVLYNPFATNKLPREIFQDSDDEHYVYENHMWVRA